LRNQVVFDLVLFYLVDIFALCIGLWGGGNWLPLLSSGKSGEQIHHVCLQLWAK